MSYYRPSYSQTVAMSRGRGFSSSRGSTYRGNSNRGGSSWGSSRGYNSSRGSNARFSSFPNSFETPRPKYPGPPDRYNSSRAHGEEYRKPYRPDVGIGFINREGHGHRSSPERKRIRSESVSGRHESYGGTAEGYGRYESSAGCSERRSFSNDRRPASLSRREDFRKPPRPASSPRGGYRGRPSPRGSLRSRIRERPARRRLLENSYAVRKRIITTRSSDYARRIKISRLRSAFIRRCRRVKLGEKEESSDEEKEDEEVEEPDEEDEAEEVKKEKNEEDATEGTEEDKDKKTLVKKSSKVDVEVPQEKEDKKADSDTEEKTKKNRFIKLVCPHCFTKCPTFIKYSMHLQSGRHMAAMRKVALKQKSILSQMRMAQRTAQRELEKTTDDLAPRTNFCPLCKLNYKQPKATHQASAAHKNMKKFLMPYCKFCKITFKSPMIYESHCCSIEHIKRKQLAHNGDKSDKDDGSEDDDNNLENFMTIDSVGDMDEEEAGDSKKKESDAKPKEPINVGIENIRKVEVHYCDLCRMYLPRGDDGDINRILAKHCKLRTHLQKYIRYKEDRELTKRAERLQRKETAEKEREKDKDKVDVKNESQSDGEKKIDESIKNDDKKEQNEEEQEDKIWADVDKDLGVILAEAESGNKSSDEDEDSVANGERFDRFKSVEKTKEDAKKVVEDEKKDQIEEEVKKEV